MQLDTTGSANVWFGSSAYKLVLKTATGSTLWSVDNYQPDSGATLLRADLASTASAALGAGLVGFDCTKVYANGTVGGGFTRLRVGGSDGTGKTSTTSAAYDFFPNATASIKGDPGYFYNTIWTDDQDRVVADINKTGRMDLVDYSGVGGVLCLYNLAPHSTPMTGGHYAMGAKNSSESTNTIVTLNGVQTDPTAAAVKSKFTIGYMDFCDTTTGYTQPNRIVEFSGSGLTLPTLPINGCTGMVATGNIEALAFKSNSGNLLSQPATSTAKAFVNMVNGAGTLSIGFDNSTGGDYGLGAYACLFYSSATTAMQFLPGGSKRLELSPSGVGFQGTAAIAKPTVTGSKGGNAALASLLTALSNYGLITDSTT